MKRDVGDCGATQERSLETVTEKSSLDHPTATVSRRFSIRRFSLRFLLILITGICIYLAMHVDKARRQREAVNKIKEHGGWVEYDYQYPGRVFTYTKYDGNAEPKVPGWLIDSLGVDFFQSVVNVNFAVNSRNGRQENENKSLAPLEVLDDLPKVRMLYLMENQVNDEAMKHVARAKHLEKFYVWDARDLSDDGIQYLVGLKELNDIHISDSTLTDRSLKVFGRLPKMKQLSLQFNDFSDAGVKDLAGLKDLESLWICGTSLGSSPSGSSFQLEDMEPDADISTPLTDKTLKTVLAFPKLKELGIQESILTDKAIAEFKRAKPNCSIYVTNGLILETDEDGIPCRVDGKLQKGSCHW